MKPRTIALLLWLLAFPVVGFSESTLNFPRLFAPSDLPSTGFALVNPGSTQASVNFTAFEAGGGIVGTVSRTIEARGQFSSLGAELFPTLSSSAWIRATSATTGLQGFWLGGDLINVNFLDGAEAAPMAQDLVFPLTTAATELNIANVATINGAPAPNTVTIRIYGSGGLEAASASVQNLPPNGVLRNSIASLFPSVNFSNIVYVRATGSGALTGTSVITDFIHSPSWSVVNGVDASIAPTEANFAHVPSGPENGAPKWTAVVGIANLSASSQTLTITYNRSAGAPVSVQRSVSGRGMLRETVRDMFQFGEAEEDGWVRVSGTGPLSGFIVYGYSGTSGVAVVPLQVKPQSAMIFSHVANGPTWATGLALLNPTAADAAIEVFIMSSTGALVGGAQDVLAASFTIPGGTKRARLLTELVPPARDDSGFVFVRSANNVPLYGLQLFFSRDLKVVANVAAGSVDPSITYVPPAPASPLPPVRITSIAPASAPRGQTLTITGSGFSAAAANNTVIFTSATGSVSAPAAAATATTVTAFVPAAAITGPVYVMSGLRFSNSAIVSVTATPFTLLANSVTVGSGQNTIADIYVPAPAGALNLNAVAIGVTAANATSANVGESSVEAPVNSTRRLWIIGDGVGSTTSVTVSGAGVTVSPSGLSIASGVVVNIAIAANAPVGPRNVILGNGNLDLSVITGGLIIR